MDKIYGGTYLCKSAFCSGDKILELNKEERFILAHTFRSFYLWSLVLLLWTCGCTTQYDGNMVAEARRGQEGGREEGRKCGEG